MREIQREIHDICHAKCRHDMRPSDKFPVISGVDSKLDLTR